MPDRHPPRRPDPNCVASAGAPLCPSLLVGVPLSDLEFVPVQEQRRTLATRAALCDWLTWSVNTTCESGHQTRAN
jgi:hypothetical protein